ncbi:universal stress protein [Rhodococcus sp. ACPA4]|jgi:nucleotide-binding universal stress UspA family protein|uniref:Nucleotide-binding universal stress UspA family protein n=2 Tax=Nocardiaceae TaxID=85025 RepID=A0A652YN89_NOCGL|nr:MULTISPECIES: universal stress protein [Rhodococcus]KJF23034.1 Universal stress protein family protein [Rhodococcus sp. AD45]NMD62517.1 universal stress protein [Nocardia globerula]NRI64784.1 universal stress protein [Rhodococcus sp. MS16]RZL25640.1 MAG: universal stress protein [Rhodococcus sp. (in: high G+C Gram-positive bacteria)]MCE4266592.1 universal stress protein [Rhodococcus globerulus]
MTIAVVHKDSPEGRAAIVHGARESVNRREQLVVLHVLDDVNVPDTDEDSAALRGEIQSALDAGGFAQTPWELRTTEHDGDPVTALVELVDAVEADLLIVGTRRMSPIGKFLLERPLQRLLLEVEVPILVVKEPLPAE